MGKIAQSKKKSTTPAKQTPNSKKQKQKNEKIDLDMDETDDEGDVSLDDIEDPINNGRKSADQSEIKSTFLTECKQTFATTDLYTVLHLEKSTATANDIKRSYYKLSLKYHPDKINDESKKDEAKSKFQILGKIYSILSDEEKKKLYDETGSIDGEDEFFTSDIKDWASYWKLLFKKVTTEDVDKFFEKYQNSDEERSDLLRFYAKHKGDMNLILEEMFSSDLIKDEPRFKEIINEAIETEEVAKYEKFVNESKKKAVKRKANLEKEAKEAEEMRKEMGIDESQESLRKAILTRRKKDTDSFIDKLAEKYSKPGKKTAKGAKVARKEDQSSEDDQIEEEDDDEDENENENVDEEDDSASEKDSGSDYEKSRKRSSVTKKKVKVNAKSKPKGKVIQKKIKRL